MTCYILLSNQLRHQQLYEKLAANNTEKWLLISDDSLLTLSFISSLSPKYIFVPHWSKRIPKSIYENFTCVMFHMTDLPFGRGGSPLQNLIMRGNKETVLSAYKCVEELDAGPIYAKKKLSLAGTAEQIFARADDIVEELIEEIIKTEPLAKEQSGQIVNFSRRTPKESDLFSLVFDEKNESNKTLERIYDHIRMLDAPGYPKAFLAGENISLEFSEPSFEDGKLTAKVVIQDKKT